MLQINSSTTISMEGKSNKALIFSSTSTETERKNEEMTIPLRALASSPDFLIGTGSECLGVLCKALIEANSNLVGPIESPGTLLFESEAFSSERDVKVCFGDSG